MRSEAMAGSLTPPRRPLTSNKARHRTMALACRRNLWKNPDRSRHDACPGWQSTRAGQRLLCRPVVV